MKKYWKLFWHFRKIQLMKMVEYRSDFIFWAIISILWTIFNFFFFTLLFRNTDMIAGWSQDELLIVLSFYTMLDAFTWSVYYPNMADYTQAVFDGSLSRYLILPVSSLFLLTTQHITYHNVPRFFIGLAVLITTLNKMHISISILQVVFACLFFVTSIVFLYAGWFLLATLSFWVERLQNINDVMPSLRKIYQVPRHVYTGITGVLFSTIVPLSLVTSVPSEILLAKELTWIPVYFISFTILFTGGVIALYRYSLKKYTSVGG
jgi:ABC-2 type transport system permease protein